MTRDRPFLALIGVAMLFALSLDFFLVGMPVYAIEVLGCPPWVPGTLLALLSLLTSTASARVLTWTAGWSRIRALRVAAVLTSAWCVSCAAALLLPPGWRVGYLLACGPLLVAGQLLVTGRINALAEAAAPPGARARYLAAFQYAFTLAGVAAPAVVALFPVAGWLPWLVVTAGLAGCVLGAGRLGASLPDRAAGPVRLG